MKYLFSFIFLIAALWAQTDYSHQGRLDRLKEQECERIGGCGADSIEANTSVIGGTTDQVIDGVAGQVMSLVFGAGGMSKIKMDLRQGSERYNNRLSAIQRERPFQEGGSETKEEYDKRTESEAAEKEEIDVCAFIPMATELVGNATQQARQGNLAALPDQASTSQTRELYMTKATHISRQKVAKTKFFGWGATALCYGVSVTRGATNIKTYAKLAGATFMGWFYQRKQKKHKDRADEVQTIISKLEGDPNCSPELNVACFCSEESSRASDPDSYRQHCLHQAYQPRFVAGTTHEPTSCINDQMEVDDQCLCAKSNSCVSRRILDMANNLNLGSAHLSRLANPLNRMLSGIYDSAELSSQGNSSLAMAKKVLKDFEDQAKKNAGDLANLNSEQKEIAKTLMSAGVPNIAAGRIASQPNRDFPVLRRGGSLYAATGRDESVKSLGYGNQNAMRRNSFSGQYASNTNPFAKFGQKNKPAQMNNPSDEIRFAERAHMAAQISKTPETFLFDIISHRYRASGWQRLEGID